MKNTLIKYFIWLFVTLAACLFMRLGLLLIVAVVAFKNDMDIWQFIQQMISERWAHNTVPDAVALLLLTLLIATLKSSHCPELARSKRSDWLKTSPWTLGKTLPWGDFQIGLPEGIILLVIDALLHFLVDWPFGITLYLFACYYFGRLYLSSLHEAAPQDFFATGIVLAIPLLFIPYFSWLIIPVFFICAMITIHAQKQNWKLWVGLDGDLHEAIKITGKKEQVGWPFCTIVEVTDEEISSNNKLLNLLLSCWVFIWIFTLIRLFPVEEGVQIMNFWYIPTFFFALIHRVAYSTIGTSPISLLGRIKLRKFIIPDYDKVYLAPVFSILGGIIMYLVASSLGNIHGLAESLAIATSLQIILSARPTIREWTYTGQYQAHRPAFTPPSQIK
ncbi:MAG: hypothetical protein QM496_16780 [Verrucomicrobiota bacterium]